MLTFNVLNLGKYTYRCVLDDTLYFDFIVKQYSFWYTSLIEVLRNGIGKNVIDAVKNEKVGIVVSISYISEIGEVWVLILNGIRGEFYTKKVMNV
ncbi:hypothetical protein COV24_03435 [candidate division WWE3 bacterium CG10_big_fil_rev_8_21_14_0_10_32_10]|uniref:Uncharacterized protein n=1 Tax=candidate division WWE3 bacterium CG10_big_fil_rev_8_21_14_0_10_32_10 TaxID=1975090 RepID=A0A2H0RBU4_UNCKA|nr:MAG: hypothetical protein COV24_03435 [candidate division WWE3 bacterium CG10_big_fil_rev_8_21_14_0_10_32_10]